MENKYYCYQCRRLVEDIHRRVFISHEVDHYPESYYDQIEFEVAQHKLEKKVHPIVNVFHSIFGRKPWEIR